MVLIWIDQQLGLLAKDQLLYFNEAEDAALANAAGIKLIDSTLVLE